MSMCEPRVSSQFAQISVELSYAAKLLYVPLAWPSKPFSRNLQLLFKCEHLLMVCAMFWCC